MPPFSVLKKKHSKLAKMTSLYPRLLIRPPTLTRGWPCDSLWLMEQWQTLPKQRLEKHLHIEACCFLILLGNLQLLPCEQPRLAWTMRTCGQVFSVAPAAMEPTTRRECEATLDHPSPARTVCTRQSTQPIPRIVRNCTLLSRYISGVVCYTAKASWYKNADKSIYLSQRKASQITYFRQRTGSSLSMTSENCPFFFPNIS